MRGILTEDDIRKEDRVAQETGHLDLELLLTGERKRDYSMDEFKNGYWGNVAGGGEVLFDLEAVGEALLVAGIIQSTVVVNDG